MDKEGASPDRVKKREAEEVSSLFSWLRGEAVSFRSLRKGEVGEWKCPPPTQRHLLVKRGRIWCLETSLEQRQMNERKCQTVWPIPTPLARVSWARSAGSISWTCLQLTRGDLAKVNDPSWELTKYRLVCAKSIGQTFLSSWANRERPSWLQNSPGNWPRLVAALRPTAYLCPQPGLLSRFSREPPTDSVLANLLPICFSVSKTEGSEIFTWKPAS